MLFIRSLIFNILMWLLSAVEMILYIPLLFSTKLCAFVPTLAGKRITVLLKICGIRHQVEGEENLPDLPYIVASKHQSAWETATLTYIFPKSTFVVKKELTDSFPLGIYIKRSGLIGVDRRGGKQALKEMLEGAKRSMEAKRPLVIFPEGTRTSVGEKPSYKRGIYILYKNLKKPVVPVALNSGLYWKRRGFFKYPGTIRMKIMPPIMPGLSQEDFMKKLETTIERETNKLIEDATK